MLNNVKRGDYVIEKWNELIAFLNSLRLQSGAGIYLNQTKDGCIISTRTEQRRFKGAWNCSIENNTIKVENGLVNAEHILDGDKNPLEFSQVDLAESKNGYVMLVCECDTDGKWLSEKTRIELKADNYLSSENGLEFYQCVAALNNSKLYQISYFDYKFDIFKRSRGTGYYGFFRVA